MPDTLRFNQVDRERIRSLYWGNPLYHIVQELRKALQELVADLDLHRGATVVDYGCADQEYRDLFKSDIVYIGADLTGNPTATIEIQDDGTLPLGDKTVDAVFSSQVLEHVSDPTVYLAECHRVLRDGGRLLLTTHGIMVHHPDPVDYWRWTSEGLQRIVANAGFQIARFEGVMGLAATGIQLFQDGTVVRVPRVLQRSYLAIMQWMVARVDRQSSESRAHNALVFALIAQKADYSLNRLPA